MQIRQERTRNRRRRIAVLSLAVSLGFVLSQAVGAVGATTPPLTFVTLTTGLVQPTQVLSTAAIPGVLFVTERRGVVRAVDEVSGAISSNPYLDLTSVVNSTGGEQGLLGMAFAPDFATSGRVYVTFTDAAGALVLRRITVSTPVTSSAGSAAGEDLLAVPHPGATNHNGGSLAFDRSGRLLLGTGDGGGAGDQFDNARNTNVLLGKVLRLDVSSSCTVKYCIPSANPFVGGGGLKEVWLWGLRNPWRTAFDLSTGLFYVADVGQDRWEELDVVPEASAGGDLQWSCREGPEQFNAARCGSTATQILPVTVMCHASVVGCLATDAGGSVTGGQVYRGQRLAASLAGSYVFGDFVTGNVWSWANGVRSLIASLPQVTSFGTDSQGELLATTLSGGLFRMTIGTTLPATTPPPASGGGGGVVAPTAPSASSGPAAPPAAAASLPTVATAAAAVSAPEAAQAQAVPARVRGLHVRTLSPSTVAVSWTRLSDAPGARFQFRVQRASRPYGPWRTVTASPVTIRGLHKGLRSRLQVRALVDAAFGPVSTVSLRSP